MTAPSERLPLNFEEVVFLYAELGDVVECPLCGEEAYKWKPRVEKYFSGPFIGCAACRKWIGLVIRIPGRREGQR